MSGRESKKILHYTMGRSGSAFISQIIRAIFGEENVWAGHEKYLKKLLPDQYLIITYRDFRDVLVSRWRVDNDVQDHEMNLGIKIPHEDLNKLLLKFDIEISESLNGTDRANEALHMKYEDFYPNKYEYIFGRIEKHCNFAIPDQLKNEISQKYNFDLNKQRSKKFDTFEKVGEYHMHGLHVYKGKIGGWKDHVDESDFELLNNTLGPHLEKWGYCV